MPLDPNSKDQEPTLLPKPPVLSFEEYSRQANASRDSSIAKAVPVSPEASAPAKDGIIKSVAKGAADIVTSPVQTAKSIGRGAVDAVDATAETAITVGAKLLNFTGLGKLLGGKEWQDTFDQIGARGIASAGTEFIDHANDSIFGPASSKGSQQFVESTASFLIPFTALGKVSTLSLLGPVAGGLVKGAITDFAAFEPYKAQLAELATNTSIPGVHALGKMLSVHEGDGPIAARFKRAVGGLIPGVAIDGLVAGVRKIRGLSVLADAKATPEAHSVAQKTVADADEVLQNIKDGTHVPNDPMVVTPTPDGKWQIEANKLKTEITSGMGPEEIQAAKEWNGLMDRRAQAKQVDAVVKQAESDANSVAGQNAVIRNNMGLPPSFDTRWEAEAQAASINEAVSSKMAANAKITLEDTKDIFKLADDIEAGGIDGEKTLDQFGKIRMNTSYLDAPDKTLALMKAVGEKLSPVFEKAQARESVSWDQSFARAQEAAGMIPKEELGHYISNVSNVLKNSDVAVVFFNGQVKDVGAQVAKWGSVLVEHPNDPVALHSAREALTYFANLVADAQGAKSGLARGLNIIKDNADRPGLKFKGEAGAVEITTKAPFAPDVIAGMTASEINTVTQLFRQTRDPRSLFETMKSITRPGPTTVVGKVGAALTEVFYNNVLSNPATWKGVWLSTGAASLYEDGIRMLAGAARFNGAEIREAANIMQGRVIYLKQTVKGMAMALKAGRSIIDPRPVFKAIPGPAGEIIRSYGSRPMAAMDEFWRANNNLAYVHAKALRLAREDANRLQLKGAEYDKFISQRAKAEVTASIDPATGASKLREAREYAALPTFSTPLDRGSIGESLQRMVQNNPILRPILPFVPTSVNIMNYGFLKSSPLGVFSKNFQEAMKRGGQEAAIAGTRMAVGTTLWGVALHEALNGEITGYGPNDPKLRQMWLDAGNQPYSFKARGEWVSYRRVEPFATMMSTMADLVQIQRDHSDDPAIGEGASKAYYGIIAATMSGMTNKTYLSGLVNFMDAIGSRNSQAATKTWADQMMGSMVPSGLGMFNADPYMREATGAFDALKNRVPGWGNSPAKYNVFGEARLVAPSRKERSWAGMPSIEIPTEPGAEAEFLQLNKAFTAPPTIEKFGDISVNLHNRAFESKSGSTLTPYEFWMDKVRAGDLRGKVDKLLGSGRYERAGDGTDAFEGGRKFKLVQNEVDRALMKGREAMLHEYPELAKQLKGLARARRASQRSDTRGQNILDKIPQ